MFESCSLLRNPLKKVYNLAMHRSKHPLKTVPNSFNSCKYFRSLSNTRHCNNYSFSAMNKGSSFFAQSQEKCIILLMEVLFKYSFVKKILVRFAWILRQHKLCIRKTLCHNFFKKKCSFNCKILFEIDALETLCDNKTTYIRPHAHLTE